jgi:protein TonB
MNPSLLLDTLLVWSAQILVLVTLGWLAALTLAHPKGRLLFWQGLLLMLLLLPVVEPWRQPPPEATPRIENAGPPLAAGQNIGLSQSRHWRSEDWLALIALGAGLRLLWIAIGFLRLRRYRREARRLPETPVPFGGVSARWYLHDALPGPVTYGWLRPSILLPARFEELPHPVREAIACHELVHVWRRDWLFVIAEELVRGAFWFHPAIWFVLSRIHLAREQAVDREVIGLTADRDRYLEALMTVAKQKIRPDLAPAPLFLKKRHLARRVAAVLQEVSMSRSRLYASFAAVCSTVLMAATLSIWLFPFASPALVLPDDPGITVDAGGTLMHRTPVHFPPGVKSAGTVMVDVTLNAKGEVTDARVSSGPEDLRKAALASVLEWHYAAGLSTARIGIQFGENVKPDSAQSAEDLAKRRMQELDERKRQLEVRRAQQPVSPPAPPRPSLDPNQQIHLGRGLSAEAEQALRSRLPIREGDSIQQADLFPTLPGVVRELDSHLNLSVRVARSPDGRPELALTIGVGPPDAPPPPPADFGPGVPGVPRVRVGSNVEQAKIQTKVTPVYPPLAKQARLQGTVRFNALIGTDGAIKELQLVSGHPLLTESASDAVKQWTYKPTLLNGAPVEIITQIDVNYTLLQ